MASANVFSGFLRPARTVFDYTSDLEAIDTSKLNRRRGEAELAQLQRRNTLDDEERARATASRNAFEGLLRQSGGDQNKLLQALQSSGDPAMFAQAQALEKSMLEAQGKRATIGKDTAAAGKAGEETMGLRLKQYSEAFGRVTDPSQAAQLLMAQYNDPVVGPLAQRMGPLMQVANAIPQDPQGFAQWRERQALGMAKFAELEQQRSTAAATQANNLMIPGPDGTFVPNRPLIGAKKEIGAASSPKVNVNTDSLGLKPKDRFEMEGKLADDYKAVTKLDNLVLSATSKIKTALAQPGAIKDQAAIYSFAKMLDPDGAVREADYAAISNTAGLGDRIMSYIQRMKTGEQLTPTQRQEMLQMMEAFEGVAKGRIAAAQDDFGSQARQYNLRPDSVFSGSRTGGPAKPAGPKPSAPAAGPSVSNW